MSTNGVFDSKARKRQTERHQTKTLTDGIESSTHDEQQSFTNIKHHSRLSFHLRVAKERNAVGERDEA